MKCCHYERHLTMMNLNGTFSDQFILAKAKLFFFVIPLYWGGATSSLVNFLESIQVFHLIWGSASLYLPSEPHIYSFHILTHSYLVGRSVVVGHILTVHTCSLMCTNHINMTAHTPVLFTELGTTLYIYVECSTDWHSHISHLWSNASRMVSHPCINWARDGLTSVIKRKPFTPC